VYVSFQIVVDCHRWRGSLMSDVPLKMKILGMDELFLWSDWACCCWLLAEQLLWTFYFVYLKHKWCKIDKLWLFLLTRPEQYGKICISISCVCISCLFSSESVVFFFPEKSSRHSVLVSCCHCQVGCQVLVSLFRNTVGMCISNSQFSFCTNNLSSANVSENI
jgi:hypothetical protein